MRTHPEAGERILLQSDVPPTVREIVRWHHERWDGSGYPDGLAGDAIPLAVQVITVVDVFDALVSRRPYKEPWSFSDALDENPPSSRFAVQSRRSQRVLRHHAGPLARAFARPRQGCVARRAFGDPA